MIPDTAADASIDFKKKKRNRQPCSNTLALLPALQLFHVF